MPGHYIGHLSREDPLYGHLQDHITPQQGFSLPDASYRVFRFNDSRDVYLYEEIHQRIRIVGKFFKSSDPGHARKTGETEFNNLIFLRDLGFSAPPHSVVKPYGSAVKGLFQQTANGNRFSRFTHLSVLCLLCCVFFAGACAKPPVPSQPAYRAPAAHPVVQTARAQIGVAYAWGGTSPQAGFDCSGLIVWVFARHGLSLPRTTQEQVRAGVPASLDDLRPADLVFFRIGKRGALHAGIYAGQGTFIHSAKPGDRVREEALFSTYWRQRLIAVRRVI